MFDIKIKNPKGATFCAYFKRRVSSEQEMAAVTTEGKKKINADVVHGFLGHINDADVRLTTKNLVYNLKRKSLTL